jgi:putative tryptophan/tyrosine transport system substrate-binding protein
MGWAVSRRQLLGGSSLVAATLLAGCGSLPWQAPPPAKLPRIGFLASGSPRDFDGFREGLRDLGYQDGQNVTIEYRDPEGQTERLPDLAAELVALPVDVLVAASGFETAAAMRATSTLPIVFVYHADPVGAGHVASLARPGGNVTGTSFLGSALVPKRIELLQAAMPSLVRLAILLTTARPQRQDEARNAARALGMEPRMIEVRDPEDLDRALAMVVEAQAEALTWLGAPMFGTNSRQIAEFARMNHLATMGDTLSFAVAGGLMVYAANANTIRRRSAYYVDRILKGARPADLPVEQPTEFDFVINLGTARALGLTIPEHVLVRATEVIP